MYKSIIKPEQVKQIPEKKPSKPGATCYNFKKHQSAIRFTGDIPDLSVKLWT